MKEFIKIDEKLKKQLEIKMAVALIENLFNKGEINREMMLDYKKLCEKLKALAKSDKLSV